MKILILFLFIVFTHAALANVTFEQVAEKEIRELIYNELWSHYDVVSVSILETKDHTAEWGGRRNGYGIKTVVAGFVATRNKEWHKNLNRKVVEASCNLSSNWLWVLCRPAGYKFEGKLEVDLVATNRGWKILSRNFRNRREFVLSNYLLLEGRSKEGYVLSPTEDAR